MIHLYSKYGGTYGQFQKILATPAMSFIIFQSHLKKEYHLKATPMLYAAISHTYVGINFNIFVERSFFLISLQVFRRFLYCFLRVFK
jgi:hypothetical protein